MVECRKIWMDGVLVDGPEARVHILTHSLHYGLAVFEGIRAYHHGTGQGAVFRLPEHTARLFDSAHIMQMEIPFSRDEVNSAVVDTLRANGLTQGYIRPIAYIGAGEMGLFPGSNPVRLAIAAWDWGAYLGEEGLKRGIRIKVSSFIRHHVNSSMSKAKVAGNYVNSILSKREAVGAGFDEALMLDTEGYVSEGSGENVFVVKDGVLKTTPLTSILKGITRDSVMRIARDLGIPLREERFTRDEVYAADEAFFTGTAAEVTPIREVDGRTIGTGRPGPLTLKIQDAFFRAVRGETESYRGWLTPYALAPEKSGR